MLFHENSGVIFVWTVWNCLVLKVKVTEVHRINSSHFTIKSV